MSEDEELTAVRPGDVVAGKFRVERVLGAGGMGVVVAATHLQLDQLVALKFLLPSALQNADVAARFAREARAAAKIRSEHVTRVFDVGFLESGQPYIVMEFLEGRDIGQRLESEGGLPIELAVDYVLQACEAIAEAHARGIVHRDLKPANLFIATQPDGTEVIKVLDFGISKAMPQPGTNSDASVTKTTDVFGSPMYMSPEQLKASRDVDARADIWALGSILFELLAGQPPFSGGTVAEIFGAILYKPTPALREARPDVPPGLEATIGRCLEKSPDARFADVGDLVGALAPFGGASARQSTTRIARVLNKASPAIPTAPTLVAGGATPTPDALRDGTVSDIAARRAAAAARSAVNVGSATATAWSESRPRTPTRSKQWLIAAAAGLVLIGGGGIAARALLHRSPVAPGGTAAAETSTAMATVAPTPVAAPNESGAVRVEPSAATESAVPAPPTSSAHPKVEAPRTAGKQRGGPPSTAKSSAPGSPSSKPSAGGDDEWGGGRK